MGYNFRITGLSVNNGQGVIFLKLPCAPEHAVGGGHKNSLIVYGCFLHKLSVIALSTGQRNKNDFEVWPKVAYKYGVLCG